MIVSAGHRAGAGVTGEVEVDGYGGRTSGGWVCGPMGSVAYGGAAVKASIAQRDRQTPEGEAQGQGTVGAISAAIEGDTITVRDGIESGSTAKLSTGGAFGAHATAGYRWRYIGIEGGVGFIQGWSNPTRNAASRLVLSPEFIPIPNVEVSFGDRSKVFGVVGGGSPLATSVMRPGFYGGGGVVLDNGMAFDLRAGLYRQGPAVLNEAGPRLDFAGRGPVSDSVSLRLGGNIGFHDNDSLPLDFEGSVGVIFGY